MSINRTRYHLEQNCKTSASNSDYLHTSFGYPGTSNTNFLTSSPVSIHSSLSMERETSPDFLKEPLIQSLQPLKRQSSKNGLNSKLQKHTVSLKDVFKNRKQNISLDELAQDQGYRVYYAIFRKIRFLLIILGLWAPNKPGCAYWCLRNLYPIFIYFLILYPWTTFITQEAYLSVPVFLFINLHLSGITAYRSARKYWKQNHLVNFITSTFIPYYEGLNEFEERYRRQSLQIESQIIDIDDEREEDIWDSPRKTLAQGFQQRYRKDNRKRKRNARLKLGRDYNDNDRNNGKYKKNKGRNKKKSDEDVFDLHESLRNIRKNTEDPFKKHPENLSSWSSIAGAENKLSLSLFYEATKRMWWRFWILTFLTAVPIVAILVYEALPYNNILNSISDKAKFKEKIVVDIFIPFNLTISFIRIFYNICEFTFMAFYFQFICECHRGDLLIHLHYYDTSDIDEKHKESSSTTFKSLSKYYQALEFRLASIVWDWDRIASSIRDTSRAFRWWIFVMVVFNFIAGITAIINLTTRSLQQFPQHLEMYLPAVVNIALVFYVLLTGTKVSHMNKTVSRRTYFLLATTHFSHIEITHGGDGTQNNEDEISLLSRDIDRSVVGPSRSPMLSSVAINIAQVNSDEEMSINDNHKNGFPFSPIDTSSADNNGGSSSLSTNNIRKSPRPKMSSAHSNVDSMELQIRKQNLYIQAQTVARAARSREIGISVYGMVLNRSLFLAFFSPFVAFFLFCINTWLPNES